MVHAELDHAGAVLRAQPQQRQRHADIVVEIAFGRERARRRARRAGSPRSSASPWSCRCCRSPRSAAARSAGASAAASSPSARRLSATSKPGRPASAMPRSASARDRAGGARLRQDSRAHRSARRAARRTGRRRAGCGCRCARAARVIAGSPTSVRAGQQSLRQCQRHHGRLLIAARRGATQPALLRDHGIGERQALRRRSPGSPRGPCRRSAPRRRRRRHAARQRSRRAGPRSRSRRCGARRPATISAMIGAGTSRRGLSLVTTTRCGQPLGDRGHQRALGAVAVAAAAEDAPQHAAARRGQRLQRLQRLLERIGRMRIVDDDQRRAGGRRRRSAASGPAPAVSAAQARPRRPAARRCARSAAITASRLRDVEVADQRACAAPTPCAAFGDVERQPAVAIADLRARPAVASPAAEQVHRSSGAVGQLSRPARRPAASSRLTTAARRPGQSNSRCLARQ